MASLPPDPATVAFQRDATVRGVTSAKASHGGQTGRDAVRPLPVHSRFPSALPITPEEIHKVLAALGPDLAAIFDEEA